MGRKGVIALAVCLLGLGLAAFVAADEPSHSEPGQVTATCSTTASVAWAAVNDAHLSGYYVYKKAASDLGYVLANSELVTTTHFTVTGLSSGTAYRFGVIARLNDGHSSAMSIPATCTTS
ncbi:MAG: fibronectin type III domain-containing protein [Methanobacteriota archaeon]|nr:MAG: fibronectin type III domain-containing protein [Euryarchaeota archaeon]